MPADSTYLDALRYAKTLVRDPVPDEPHACNALGKAGERYRVDLRCDIDHDPRFAPLADALDQRLHGEEKRAAIQAVIDRIEGERLAHEAGENLANVIAASLETRPVCPQCQHAIRPMVGCVCGL